MPRKKKSKDASHSQGYTFDYRYTPKPYFTAVANSPATGITNTTSQVHDGFSPSQMSFDRWSTSSKPTNSRVEMLKAGGIGHNSKQVGNHSHIGNDHQVHKVGKGLTVNKNQLLTRGDINTADPENDRLTMTTMFVEMFKGRLEPNVIEMVLQEVNWNGDRAFDQLSQLADPHPQSSALNGIEEYLGLGTITPDHNLTPTAPTLSYCSSTTSLNEFVMEQSRDVTDRNLLQVADVLRHGEVDDVNDLDRQRRALSRATTPRSVLKNSSLAAKNISSGSTESLESNRSHDPSSLFTASSTLSSRGTLKRSSFDEATSLVDISCGNDRASTLPSSRSSMAVMDTARSDPGNPGNSGNVDMPVLIRLEHGDIVLEKVTYPMHDVTPDETTPINAKNAIKPMQQSGTKTVDDTAADNCHAMTSLTAGLNSVTADRNNEGTEEPPKISVSSPDLHGEDDSFMSSSSGSDGIVIVAGSNWQQSNGSTSSDPNDTAPEDGDAEMAAGGKPPISSPRPKDSDVLYSGILSSGSAVPTALVAARPKTPRHKRTVSNEKALTPLLEIVSSDKKVMFILRGAPGSGKSTLARRLVEGNNGIVVSSDEYFYNEKGEYIWDSSKLSDAHNWSKQRAEKSAEEGHSPLVIDNTNTQAWEMEPYVKIALINGYRPILAEAQTLWRYKAKELARRNTHKVPVDKIQSMLDRFEHDVNIDKIIDYLVKREPSLGPMATQLRSMQQRETSSKMLSSKTIKRNKQSANVEKIKDKNVTDAALEYGIDDKQTETQIMYPSRAVQRGARRATVKVINCDLPNQTAETDKAELITQNVDLHGELKSEGNRSSPEISKDGLRGDETNNMPADDIKASSGVRRSDELNTPDSSESCNEQIAPACTASTNRHEVDITPLDPAVLDNLNSNDPPKRDMFPIIDQLEGSQDKSSDSQNSFTTSTKLDGSATFPRDHTSITSSKTGETYVTPDKAKKSRNKKTGSVTYLPVDDAVKERWLNNEWELPPYPHSWSESNIKLAKHPPPSYEDSCTQQSSIAVAADLPVKRSDQYTLTEPSDYATAYKAMQYNKSLPHGWSLIIGHSIPPFVASNTYDNTKTVLTYDKGTCFDADETESDTSGISEEYVNEKKLKHLKSCFPDVGRSELSHILKLCHGDQNWATNLLLDTNKVHMTKNKKLNRILSLPGYKRMKTKVRHQQRQNIMKSLGKHMSLTSCLGVEDMDLCAQREANKRIDITINQEMALQLHSLFNAHAEPPVLGSDMKTVPIPNWILRSLYHCLMESLENPTLSPSATYDTSFRKPSGGLPKAPSRPNRARVKNRLRQEKTPTVFSVRDSALLAADDWPSYDPHIKSDEELARRLQAEDLLSRETSKQSGSSSLTEIMDEELALSMVKSALNQTGDAESNVAVKLRRQQLYEKYPQSDKAYLEEVFHVFGYNLENTMRELDKHHFQHGDTPPKHLGSRERSDMTQEGVPDDDDMWMDVEEIVQGRDVYETYRAEAQLHQKKRQECQEKSQAARQKKLYPVAAHYTTQAQYHGEKMKEAHQRAANCIFASKNKQRPSDVIDLHGLHAEEVESLLEGILPVKKNDNNLKYLYVITGHGKNSRNGTSKLKRAVETHLARNNISYQWENPGMLRLKL